MALMSAVETLAFASESDFGLGIWASEEGSDQWESVVMGLSWQPTTAEWSNNHNENSNVHISLDHGLIWDIRDIQNNPNWVFNGSITCEDQSRNYIMRFGYVDCSTGGPWDLPPFEPKVTLTQCGASNSSYLSLEWGSTDLYMGGNFDFTVDFHDSSVVPEPSSLLAAGLGLGGLGGHLLRRRAA